MRVDEPDLLTLVSGLGEERLGARQIRLTIGFGAGLRLVRAAADKEAVAGAPPMWVAVGSAKVIGLTDDEGERLARLLVVEGRVERIRADRRGVVELRDATQYDAWRFFEDRDLVMR